MEKPESMERGDRPWGYYLVLHEDAGYKVKQFVVRPGSRLSLQRHRHRAEHWQVVRGEATVTLGKEQVRLAPGGSIDIPRGALHRVESVGKENLVVIEVQRGSTWEKTTSSGSRTITGVRRRHRAPPLRK